LHALTRPYPSLEESNELWREVRDSAPRAAGITAATFVENVLAFVVSNRLVLRAPADLERLRNPSGPLHSFSDCIDLGIAMGLYGPVLHADLHGIHRVRNAFANTLTPISFDTPVVESEINKMAYFATVAANPRIPINELYTPALSVFLSTNYVPPAATRQRFTLGCELIWNDLLRWSGDCSFEPREPPLP
jgi:hypothetical protein